MTTRLFLIAHASTPASRAAAFPQDEALDAFGLADATAAAAGGPWSADQYWSGPELRARQTATALGLDAAIDPALRDCDYGSWGGLTLAEIGGATPEALNTWLRQPAAVPHGGESLLDLLARVAAWLDQLQLKPRRTGSTRVIAVTHPSVIRAAIVYALDAAPASFWRVDVAPLSRVTLVHHSGRWTLKAIERRFWGPKEMRQ